MSTVTSTRGFCDENYWPPGFRFHPTDEELVLYYLKFKICRRKIKLDIIRETDVYKCEPEELPGKSLLKTGDRLWFFFSPRERRYPNAARLSRATRHGYWKATGKDRIIRHNSRDVGVKKTLVFYHGRAPNGERTDWVMHEYTLDEDELKRCNNVQDYYALYKVFKKSGPGPKNGEQYGAPFKEEDWGGDDCQDFNNHDDQEPLLKLPNEVTSVSHERENVQLLPASDNIEEFLEQIAKDCVVELPDVNDYSQPYSVLQVDDKEETENTMVNVYSQDRMFPEADKVLYLNSQPSDLQASFGFTPKSGVSQLQSFEGEVSQFRSFDGEVSSAPKLCEDSYIEEDFLEIDDLIGPEPTSLTTEITFGDFPPAELDGLSELDLFHDADMFLRDLGPVIHHETLIDSHLNAHVNDVINHLDSHLLDNPYVGNQMDNQLWKNDESGNAFTLPESHQEFVSQSTLGVGYESSSFAVETKQNQTGNEGSGSASWFSSNLWAFVDSIPTTPASASENVNRAFERMSSFSRLRLNTLNTNVTVSNPDPGTKRAGMNKGFLLFSIVGVLCAILWMLIGNVRLWGSCVVS